MGKLYIVSTPIGNLEDITFRAIRVLSEVSVILAEDTRSAHVLLKHYKIGKPKVLSEVEGQIISFFEGNEEKRIPEVINLLHDGRNVALISESGTPLVSDPGYKLVRECIQREIPIEAIPGPTAVVTALTVSGLPPNAFIYLGFLPKKEGKARKMLEGVKNSHEHLEDVKTVILYESPYRLSQTLNLIKEVFGDINIVVARELTKFYEEVRREKVSESIEYFTKTKPRGEFVVLFAISHQIPSGHLGGLEDGEPIAFGKSI